MKNVICIFIRAVGFLAVACLFGSAQSIPQVHLDAEGLAPRPIEELTGNTIAHHYAFAWRDMASALESGQVGEIGEEFTGFAKDRLMRRIAEQQKRLGRPAHRDERLGEALKASDLRSPSQLERQQTVPPRRGTGWRHKS